MMMIDVFIKRPGLPNGARGYTTRLPKQAITSSRGIVYVQYRGTDTFDSIARATSGCNTPISNESKDYAATSIV